MSIHDAWHKAFPHEAAVKVVKHVVETWQALVEDRNPHFSWQLYEPKITKRFKQRLENGADDAGLTGAWGSEGVSMDFHPSGNPSKEWRTDITYHSDRDPTRILRLTFEFKKLTHKRASRKAYYGPDGMGRFLAGTYARKADFGLMVAIIESDAYRSNVDILKSVLQDDEIGATLNYISEPSTGKWLREPSTTMPALADFDTHHHREKPRKPGTFMFSHLVLAFADVS